MQEEWQETREKYAKIVARKVEKYAGKLAKKYPKTCTKNVTNHLKKQVKGRKEVC